MTRFNHLNVPDQWNNYFTRYPQGYTILEALLNWVGQVDNMVDNQNRLNLTVENYRIELDDFINKFDPHLKAEIVKILGEWQESGFLNIIINEALQTQMDEVDTRLSAKILENKNRLEDISINVKEYGAICDGVTDDTLAINNALLNAPFGSLVVIPSNTVISSPLLLQSGKVLAGVTKEVQIKLKDLSNCDMVKVASNDIHDFGIKDITLDGNKLKQYSGNGINILLNFIEDKKITISNITINNCFGNGLSIEGRCPSLYDNIIVYNCGGMGIISNSYDSVYVSCDVGYCDGIGFRIEKPNNKYIGCKSWYVKEGYHFTVGAPRGTLSGCEAQDIYEIGLVLESNDYNIDISIDTCGYKNKTGAFLTDCCAISMYGSTSNSTINAIISDKAEVSIVGSIQYVLDTIGTNNRINIVAKDIIKGISKNPIIANSDANIICKKKDGTQLNLNLNLFEGNGFKLVEKTSKNGFEITKDTITPVQNNVSLWDENIRYLVDSYGFGKGVKPYKPGLDLGTKLNPWNNIWANNLIYLPSHAVANRPIPVAPCMVYDSANNIPIFWTGLKWIKADGTNA